MYTQASIRKVGAGNKDAMLLAFVVFMLFLWGNGFNLRIFDLSEKYKVLNLLAHFLLLAFACIRIPFVRKNTYLGNKYFWYIVGMAVVFFVPTYIYLSVFNNLNAVEVARSSFGYCGLLIFVILMSYKTSEFFVVRLNNVMFTIVTINLVLLIALSLFPGFAQDILVNTMSRYDRIRLMIAAAIGLMPHFYFFYVLVKCKDRYSDAVNLKYVGILLLYVWYFFALDMSRRTLFALMIVSLLYYFFNMSMKDKVKIVFVVALVLPILWLASPQFETITNTVALSVSTSYSEYESEDGNVGIRFNGIQYYQNLFADTWYTGIGLYSNRLPSSDPYSRGVVDFMFNPNDHGFFSVIYRYGILGAAFTIYLLVKVFKDLSLVNRKGPPEYKPIALAASLYLVYSVVAMLEIFWKPALSLWVGTMFFMIWKMYSAVDAGVPSALRTGGGR